MPFKRIIKYFFIVSALIVLLVLILLPHVLPVIVQKLITQRVISETGLKDFHVNIRSIGFSGVNFNEIKLGKTAAVDSAYIDYHLSSLLKKKTDGIHISGLVARARLNGSHIKFPDSDITRLVFMKTNGSLNNSETTLLPAFLPDKISIMNSSLILNIKGKTFVVPFNMTASLKRGEKSISMMLQVFPFGERMDISITADLKSNTRDIEIKADSFCLDQADKLISMYFPKFYLTGDADIKISKKTGSPWVVLISRIGVKSPFHSEINNFIFKAGAEGSSSFAQVPALVSGSFALSGLFPVAGNGCSEKYLKFMSPVKIDYSGNYDMKKNHRDSWSFSIKARDKDFQELLLESTGNTIHIKKPAFDLRAKGRGLKGSCYITGTCLKGAGNYKNTRISFLQFKLTGKGNFDFTRTGRGLNLNLKTESEFIKFITDDFYSNFPDVKVSGKLHLDRDFTPDLTFKPVIQNAMVKTDKPEIKIKGIDLALPLFFPFNGRNQYAGKIQPGIFSAEDISFNGQTMGSLKGGIVQKGYGGVINGTAAITGLTKEKSNVLKINFRADAKLKADNRIKADLKFNSNKINISSDTMKEAYLAYINLNSDIKFHCSAMVKGHIGVKGNIGFNSNRLKTGLTIGITDGALSLENFHASGINTSLKFDDLLCFRSVPGQVLTIDKISSNDIKLSKMIVKYSIESIHSFLIENASCNWCGGRVTTGSMRFSPGKNIYSMVLYCDRLRLSQILQQVGSFRAEGEGSLNGRIPVHYANGNLSFDDGFLFSTPGLGGKIKVTGTEALTAGIPLDSPEFAQIDLAREALKNYKYKWAKLKFNTKHDNLFVKMEFDGEPEKILPFEYRKNLGRFIRVDVTSPGSHFHGMKIDVNLKLPFNRFMKFGKKLKKLLNR